MLLTQDPIGLAGGTNLYAYAGNDPVSYSDPYGLMPQGCCKLVDLAAVMYVPTQASLGDGFQCGFAGECDRQHSQPTTSSRVGLVLGALLGTIKDLGQFRHPSDPPAPDGPHTTFRRDPESGGVTHYETRQPQTNPQNPNEWETVKRYDGTGKPHFNKATQQSVPTPHVHDRQTPGGVRPARPDEVPR